MDERTTRDSAEARRRSVAELEHLIEAAAVLRDDLDGHIAICEAIIAGVCDGEDLGSVLDAADSGTWRPKLTDSLTNYERLRHRARLRLIGLGVAEGMSVSDVERRWSITRQLANRSIREAEQLD